MLENMFSRMQIGLIRIRFGMAYLNYTPAVDMSYDQIL